MKFVTVKDQSGEFIGVVDESGTRVLPLKKAWEEIENTPFPDTMLQAIDLGDEFIEKVHKLMEKVNIDSFLSLDQYTILAPIPTPRKNIYCVGKNYAKHAIEMGSKEDIPEHPIIFTKSPTTVVGCGAEVLNHQQVTSELDYEGELAVIIGKKGRGISREDALDYVFGYTILNDVTARDLQAQHKQYFIGKSLDTTCPMGPWIVHSSEIEKPHNLNIETKINGEVRQSSNTENFIFPIEEIIHVLSKGMTLEPGDIIATGTPEGVGKGFKPPRFLKSGDVMTVTIEQIGTLTNTIS
ncbi:fumarylacetoacetate hydrolase family protein [Bacillus tuaregi]|uniref:fumarylacetoacetate hydrolase family protein n=1 Tax=Bacillus tuaregi TaxID=1816695 RepID=UPI0008F8293F|nr:fumarylacetoacetate hydrolase family protein [Bacillus tuaregi]